MAAIRSIVAPTSGVSGTMPEKMNPKRSSTPADGAQLPTAAAASLPRYPIESVDNALTLMMLLKDRDSISVAEAANHLSVARSTAHRLLAMLQHHRLVQQEPVLRSYVPGPALLELGLVAIREMDVTIHVRPYLEQLVSAVEETAHFAARRGASVVFLDCVECRRAIRAGSRVGEILPAHCTASGKALLAELDQSALAALFPEQRLVGVTDRSITRRKDLMAQLAEIRQRSYATNLGESEDGLSAVAMVVRDARGLVPGAITVAGPSSRLPAEMLPAIAAAIARQAQAIMLSTGPQAAQSKTS